MKTGAIYVQPENPADFASRGLTATQIVNNQLWWHGPSWLTKEKTFWPEPLEIRTSEMSPETRAELKVLSVVISKQTELTIHEPKSKKAVPLLNYSLNLDKIVWVMSYVLRFVRMCRTKGNKNKKELSKEHLKNGKFEKHNYNYISERRRKEH